MSTSLSRDEAVRTAALRVDVSHQTPAEAATGSPRGHHGVNMGSPPGHETPVSLSFVSVCTSRPLHGRSSVSILQ